MLTSDHCSQVRESSEVSERKCGRMDLIGLVADSVTEVRVE